MCILWFYSVHRKVGFCTSLYFPDGSQFYGINMYFTEGFLVNMEDEAEIP